MEDDLDWIPAIPISLEPECFCFPSGFEFVRRSLDNVADGLAG